MLRNRGKGRAPLSTWLGSCARQQMPSNPSGVVVAPASRVLLTPLVAPVLSRNPHPSADTMGNRAPSLPRIGSDTWKPHGHLSGLMFVDPARGWLGWAHTHVLHVCSTHARALPSSPVDLQRVHTILALNEVLAGLTGLADQVAVLVPGEGDSVVSSWCPCLLQPSLSCRPCLPPGVDQSQQRLWLCSLEQRPCRLRCNLGSPCLQRTRQLLCDAGQKLGAGLFL